ncbi:hypothetical protein [Photobacterium galatheae]|uniref:Uncharacterized protein n=1 Tax=Photobacterium galatheae TaxID=1654360 RepID=A0A066RSH0_9GAMM|nr:hypothetical protein [Photobacterium galatheae]KDM93279.1 hypothetical protein EA58_01315 [Photobacterium galatheae]MCM0150401.1 hypothetical protein [Photobacterium galatheae]
MKHLLLRVFSQDDNGVELGVITRSELEDIIAFDPHESYISELENFMFPDCLTMHKKVDFSALEDTLDIKLHESIVDYYFS